MHAYLVYKEQVWVWNNVGNCLKPFQAASDKCHVTLRWLPLNFTAKTILFGLFSLGFRITGGMVLFSCAGEQNLFCDHSRGEVPWLLNFFGHKLLFATKQLLRSWVKSFLLQVVGLVTYVFPGFFSFSCIYWMLWHRSEINVIFRKAVTTVSIITLLDMWFRLASKGQKKRLV